MSLMLRLNERGGRYLVAEQSEETDDVRITHLDEAGEFKQALDNPRFCLTPPLMRGMMEVFCNRPSALSDYTRKILGGRLEWLMCFVRIEPERCREGTDLRFASEINGNRRPISFQSFRIDEVRHLNSSRVA